MHARAPQHLKNQQMAQTPIIARQHIPTALRMRRLRNPGIDRRVSIFRATWNWRSDCLFIVCGPACAAVRTASRIDFILRCAIVIL
jgi:pantothenate kinase type III